ncbi:MAG TPA: polysaccharide deacetylase family protein [Thermomicrobiaceae bacterium]|nr:polysaccharide deacetylase family protein [Thermomicrobiaceae bacterium]
MRLARAAGVLSPSLLVAHALPAVAITPPGRLLFPTVTRIAVDDALALTFDDGPDRSLDAFLRALDRAAARATFFLMGEQVARAPSRAAEIVGAGHEVGVHAYRHRNHLRLAPWQVADDLARARSTIEDATGRLTRLYRPPYGVFSAWSWREAGRQGWVRVLWARWGRDWEARATPESIAARIGEPRPGDVLLLHDSDRYGAPGSWRNTLDALPTILERAAAAGLMVRPVGELLDRAPTS